MSAPTVAPSIADIAAGYAARGWNPIPVPKREKNPGRDGWPQERYTPAAFAGRDVNIGVILGAVSGGLVDVDLDCVEAVRLADTFLDPTTSVFGRKSAPRSHRLYVTDPVAKTLRSLKDPTIEDGGDRAQIVELRARSHQSIMPGSVHKDTGELVRWDNDGDPAIVHGAVLTDQVKKLAAAALLARYWKHGRRHDMSLALAGGLLNAAWPTEVVEGFILAIARAAGDDESEARVGNVRTTIDKINAGDNVTGWPTLADLTDTRIVDKVRDWLGLAGAGFTASNGAAKNGRTPPSVDPETGEILDDGDEPIRFALTDTGNAERLVAAYGDTIRYCWERGIWLVWTGTHWQVDTGARLEQLAKDVVRRIATESVGLSSSDFQATMKFAASSESAQRRKAMIQLARSEPGIPVTPDVLDADPWLLNVANGTLDLRTGEIHDHAPADLITRCLDVDYDPDAECPTFGAFLQTIFAGDNELVNYLWRKIGYALTGATYEQTFDIHFGAGANGKSTLTTTFRAMLGDYAREIDAGTLMDQKGNAIREDIADLDGARIVFASESQDGQKLSEALVKKATGGERLRARRLYENGWEFTPQFKVWLSTNHKPVIRGDEHAIWRRIRMTPFTVRIAPKDRDKKLAEKFVPEYPGILAQAVRGCLKWQDGGLAEPDIVRQATRTYRQEMDVFGNWLTERCVVGDGLDEPTGTLYADYLDYCKSNQSDPFTQRAWGERLTKRGCGFRKSGGTRYRTVICLIGHETRHHQADMEVSHE